MSADDYLMVTFTAVPEAPQGWWRVTEVTFTAEQGGPSIQLVVWQFWGRAAGAS
jgi:hypothetical protein